MKKYDVIIVGAGNGGLSAAMTFAKAHKKVLLLEKNNIPGGCATSFKRGRFEFEASLHELCQMGNYPYKGTVRKLLEYYDLNVDWVMVNEAFRSIVHEGEERFDVTLPADIEGFIKGIEEVSPHSEKPLREILQLGKMINDAVEWLGKYNNEPKGLKKVEMLFRFKDLMKLVPQDTDSVLDRFGLSSKAKHIFESYWDYISADSSHMSFAVYCFMTYTYLTQKPWIARNRSSEISLAFDFTLKQLGVDIWYNTMVKEIVIKNKTVKGVKLFTGEFIPSNYVMSNLMPTTVFGHMVKKEEVPVREKKLHSVRKLGQQCFTIYLGLDIPYEELGFKGYDTFVRTSGDTSKQYENSKTIETHKDYCVTILNEAIPDCSPEGTCIVQFSKFYTSDAFKDVTLENYFQMKDKIAKECIEDFEKVVGIDIRSHIEEIEIATPVTWARYIGTPYGDVYGYEPRDFDGMFPRIQSGHKYDVTIKGLRFCGGHGTNMDGYSQSYLSGNEQARYMLLEMEKDHA